MGSFKRKLLGEPMFLRAQIFFILLWAINLPASELNLTRGHFFLLNNIKIDYKIKSFQRTNQTLNLESDFGAGYFVRDKIALGLAVPVGLQILNKEFDIGIKPFFTYFFNIKKLTAYAGLNFTGSYKSFGSQFNVKTGIDAGILVPIIDKVALDFGVHPEITYKLSSLQDWFLHIPVSLLGIRAFF
jgi:hypothetical protein